MKNITLSVFALLLLVLSSCEKEKEFSKAMSVQIQGYNIGDAKLEVSIEGMAYDKFVTQPNRQINFGKIYTYPSEQAQASLKIKDQVSGKEVYNQQLDLKDPSLELFFPFVLLGDNALEIKPPTPDPSTNKMAFYIHYPKSNDAIDVFLKNDEGKIAYLAKSVLPGKWNYADYITPADFKNSETNYTLYFTKAGTTDQWAFEDSEQKSKTPTGTLKLPKFEQKGLVCSYFITPAANQLDAVRLFK